MINIDDEMLNRFLENDLDRVETDFVRNAIASSAEVKKRYEALLKAHEMLKSVPVESPSIDFTKFIMSKLSARTSIVKQQKYFLFSILSILGLLIIAFTGYTIYQVVSTVQVTGSKEIVIDYSKTIGDYISGIFSKNSLSVIGSILSLIMIISGYFLFEYQRHSKNKFIH